MPFPLVPVTELWIDGAWTAITSSVLAGNTDGIGIVRGRSDETGRVEPSRLSLTLRDPDGDFNNGNPLSPYYRRLGRNTPIRVRVGSDVRFHGEIASLTPQWDPTGRDVRVAVDAAGIMQRLTVGAKPLRSAAYRTITAEAGLVGYWSGEDGEDSTRLAADTPGAAAVIVSGDFDYAADSAMVGSAPLGKLTDTATLRAAIPTYTAPSPQQWAMTWMWRVPEAPTNAVQVMVVYTPAGTIKYWTLDLNPAGDPDTLVLHGWSADGVDLLADSMTFAAGTDTEPYGVQLHMALRVSQDGANVDYQVDCTGPGGTSTLTGTDTTSTLGAGTVWALPGSWPDGGDDDAAGLTYGHFAFFSSSTALAAEAQSLATGWAGETAAARMTRLCAEEDVPFTLDGTAASTEAVGPQQIDTLLELLFTAAEVDGGLLYEPRDSLGLAYKPRRLFYNQAPALQLSYNGKHLTGEFRPVEDDQHTRNSVTVSRIDGSSARHTIPDGDFFHLATEDPPDGVGIYEEQHTLNAYADEQLDNIAQWLAHLGAWRQQRFPAVSVTLTRPEFTGNAALTADVQAVDLADYITVDTSNSLGWLPTDQVDLLVQGYDEQLAHMLWDFNWTATPALPWEVWQVDTSGSTLVVARDTDDTSWKLATSLGPEWSTVDEPYHIQCAGEAVTVTAMTTDAPAFIAAGTVAHGNNASITPALPAGITADTGQLLLIWAAIRNSGTGTVNLPSGWANIVNFGNCRLMGRYYATGDAAPLVTFSGGVANADASARMFAFSGLSMEIASGTKATPAAATQLNGSAANVAYPACKVQRDGGVVLWLVWKQDDWTSVTGPGDAEIMDNATTTGDDQAIAAYYDIYTTAADTSSGSVTVTGGASAISRAVVVALRPLQTATVTRGVNGVSTSPAAGEAIHGWRMGVNAL